MSILAYCGRPSTENFWYISRTFGILSQFGALYSHLVTYYSHLPSMFVLLVCFSRFGKLYREKSGNAEFRGARLSIFIRPRFFSAKG
jgi:hypothetical protein